MDSEHDSVTWVDGKIRLIDQTKLPQEFEILMVSDVATLIAAIKRLSVRGAPALGVAGAYGVVLAWEEAEGDTDRFRALVSELAHARPTAVNLAKMVRRVIEVGTDHDGYLHEAHAVREAELEAELGMGRNGSQLTTELLGAGKVKAMTICNTGGLASVRRGTALAVIQTLYEEGRLTEALALETRPLLQGGRLTTWELANMGAPYSLIVDSAGPYLMARGEADIVFVGADRIAANGDTANKIGTFSLALGAQHARIPFVVVAPESTVDMATLTGNDIEIEDRGPAEVVSIRGVPVTPVDTGARNPAFDVTPAELITAIVTDTRVIRLDKGETL